MQRIVQINLAGHIVPIEEDAYLMLKDYLSALESQYATEEGCAEIVQDIETRIAELFSIRLLSGANTIDGSDVAKVLTTLGSPSQLSEDEQGKPTCVPAAYAPNTGQSRQQSSSNARTYTSDRIYRNPYDKVLGGVCSGLANYFDIDPVIFRLFFAAMVFVAGTGLLAYVIAWVVIPLARTPEELGAWTGRPPYGFQEMKRNMAGELNDLKARAEEMSRELRDFFSKKNRL